MADGVLSLVFKISADPTNAIQGLSLFSSASAQRLQRVNTQIAAWSANSKNELAQWGQSLRAQMSMAGVALSVFGNLAGNSMDKFAMAMGRNIQATETFGSSVAIAMEKATKATVKSIADKALVHAIYATALGFLRLAEFDFPAAAEAFEAAAMFGATGAATAAIGAAIPGGGREGRSAGALHRGTAETGGRSTRGAGSSPAGLYEGSGEAQVPHTIVNIQGVVSADTLGKLLPQLSTTLNQGTKGGIITLASSSSGAIPRPAA